MCETLFTLDGLSWLFGLKHWSINQKWRFTARFVLHTIISNLHTTKYPKVIKVEVLQLHVFKQARFPWQFDKSNDEMFTTCLHLWFFIGYFVAHNFISNRWIHGSRCGSWKEPAQWRRHWSWWLSKHAGEGGVCYFPSLDSMFHHFFIKVLIWLVNHAFLYHFCRCRIEVLASINSKIRFVMLIFRGQFPNTQITSK